MRVFVENQRFRQWWLVIIAAILILGISLSIFYEYQDHGILGSGIVSLAIVIFIFGMLFSLKLETRINAEGVFTQFQPLPFFQKKFYWNQIEKIYVRTYSPLTEYGGWGVRGFGKAKAYNVSGDKGIQIVTKDGYRFLIGTKKPEKARKVIERMLNKNKLR